YTIGQAKSQYAPWEVPPIVNELEAVFKELPDEELMAKLKGPRRRGPKGYNPSILWRCYVTYYVLGLTSVSDLIRLLYDNPYIAATCGINSPHDMPSQPSFSRFFTKLSRGQFKAQVNKVFYRLTQRLYDTMPNFGKSVAMDATDLKAWSNGAHQEPTDKDAGWVIKTDTAGRGKFTWGYKLSLLVDTTYELPMAIKVTSGNVHELKVAPPLLSQSRRINSKFHPEHIIADMGYSSREFRHLIHRQYRATPVIKANPKHKKAIEAYPETPDWQLIYNRRSSAERVFGRLKCHRKLNHIRVRGIRKVTVHCLMSIIVFQAQALATGPGGFIRKVA
ncbi:MAG: transposase, partial [Dehalococcoidia bacterium]